MIPLTSSARFLIPKPSVVAGAVLLACLYLPTLVARFDFTDDGNLVYPTPAPTATDRLACFWDRVVDNFNHLGPFRPVVWTHWEIAAELFGADAVRWRLARLGWNAVSAGMLLWLLCELGARPGPAMFTAALAMGSAYRSEIWTSLTLSEGVAMPYALGTLVCAVRAARSRRPWRWDCAGLFCAVAALGCKNTFAALVPAQFALRLFEGGLPLREAWQRHRLPALLLVSVLILPAAHYVVFRLNWHPGQYTPGQPTWAQFERMLKTLAGAANLSYLGPGLLLVVLSAGPVLRERLRHHTVALLAGVLLLLAGIAVYVPLNATSARYSMPAVWGADIVLAVLLTEWANAPAGTLKRLAGVALGLGLAGVLVANLGRQERVAARAEVLWQILEHVEREAEPGAVVDWRAGPHLDLEEGIHFAWHLQGRGRGDVVVRLLGPDGQPRVRPEVPVPDAPASFLVAESPAAPAQWQTERTFTIAYWFGLRAHRAYLFRPRP